MEWSNLTSQSGAEFFRSSGVSERQVSELLNAAIRATYNQNADSVNALSAALANVQETFIITRGGHRQVFENFVREANATLFLGSQVSTPCMSQSVRRFLTDSRQGQEHQMELERQRMDCEEHEWINRLQECCFGCPDPYLAHFSTRIINHPSPGATARVYLHHGTHHQRFSS